MTYLKKQRINSVLKEASDKIHLNYRDGKMPLLKIIYASDFHGSTIVFKKFINAGLIYKADVLVYGGDITGKALIPIVEVDNGVFAFELMGKRYEVKLGEINKHLERIENIGYYPLVVKKEERSRFEDNTYLNTIFKESMKDRLKNWIEFAKNKLKDTNITLCLQLGNDDEPELENILREAEDKRVVYAENKVVELPQGYNMVSNGYANITPWHCPRDYDEELIYRKLEDLVSRAGNTSQLILNTHCPPYNTNIDLAPKLDKDLKPIIISGGVVMEHVGCISVRKIIEKYQPLIGLHGHIHESRGIDKIGRTLILNPGSDYNVGVLRAALVVLEKDKVKSYLLISG